jgi:RNA polymerase sigma factor (sigma-70 family)
MTSATPEPRRRSATSTGASAASSGTVAELVRRARRRDPMALDELVRDLTTRLGRVCASIALDDGDDALQEALLIVLRSLPSLRDPNLLYPWARRIAVREAVRIARKRVLPVEPGGAAEPPVELADLATAIDVRDALARLAPEHRAVLVLRDIDGCSEADVAQMLGVAEGTVKSRLHRARAAFEKRWRA